MRTAQFTALFACKILSANFVSPGGEGDFAYERVGMGMLVGNFELNPSTGDQSWCGAGFFDPKKRPYLKYIKYIFYNPTRETLNETKIRNLHP